MSAAPATELAATTALSQLADALACTHGRIELGAAMYQAKRQRRAP